MRDIYLTINYCSWGFYGEQEVIQRLHAQMDESDTEFRRTRCGIHSTGYACFLSAIML
jgi:hypothetical protein